MSRSSRSSQEQVVPDILFFTFQFNLILFFLAHRKGKAEGPGQKKKEIDAAAISMGWGPAACTMLQGDHLAGTQICRISLPFLLMPEVHVTCDHLSLLPETTSFCLASSKTAYYFSVPVSGGIVYSE